MKDVFQIPYFLLKMPALLSFPGGAVPVPAYGFPKTPVYHGDVYYSGPGLIPPTMFGVPRPEGNAWATQHAVCRPLPPDRPVPYNEQRYAPCLTRQAARGCDAYGLQSLNQDSQGEQQHNYSKKPGIKKRHS